MLAVRSQHLLVQELQLRQQQQQHQPEQNQQQQQPEQQSIAEAVALHHLEGQAEKFLQVLHRLFPGRLNGEVSAEAVAEAAAGAAATTGKPLRVAGYYNVGSEYSCLPLLERLCFLGAEVSLPVCPNKGRQLRFRRFYPSEALRPGKFGIPCPPGDRLHPEVSPEVLLVPLLAFDAAGRRLGYGGGFYDTTIATLKAAAAPAAVALAAPAAAAGAGAPAARTPGELLHTLKSMGSLNAAAPAANSAAGVHSTRAATAAEAATAAAVEATVRPLVCGVGFGCQEVSEGTVPFELHDELLDLVLAEEELRIFNPKIAKLLQ
ncbi:hypothetical protein Efla_006378 [Eimeria flavescens]